MARPKVDFKEDVLENLASIRCTYEEVALYHKCSVKTVKRALANPRDENETNPLREAWERGKTACAISLRRTQFSHAQLPNSAGVHMAIHLGKHYLGQTDKNLVEMTGKDGGPLEFRDLSKLSDAELDLLETLAMKAQGGEEDTA